MGWGRAPRSRSNCRRRTNKTLPALLELLENAPQPAFARFDFDSSFLLAARLRARSLLSRLWRNSGGRERWRCGCGFQRFGVRRLGSFGRDKPALTVLEPVAIPLERPHAVIAAGFQRGTDFEKVAIADEVFYGVRGNQYFAFGHANVEVRPKVQPLGNNRQQAVRQLGTHRALNLRGKGRRHPLNRLGAGRRMDRGEDEMAGFRR